MLLQAPSTVAKNTIVHIAIDTHLADADLVLLSVWQVSHADLVLQCVCRSVM